MAWVKCGKCYHTFEIYGGESKSCPKCGHVASSGASSQWVKCGKCYHKFEVYGGESKSCPKCGQIASR